MHLTALLKYTHRIDWRWSHIRETQNDPNFSNKTLYAVKRIYAIPKLYKYDSHCELFINVQI